MTDQSQDEFTPKPISLEAVPMALERAERYRLLNDPVNAESICRDILALDPENLEAERTLILSLTEQFNQGMASRLRETRALANAIQDDYQRFYLTGLICERQAGAQKRRSSPGWGHIAYDLLREAMDWYEQATVQKMVVDKVERKHGRAELHSFARRQPVGGGSALRRKAKHGTFTNWKYRLSA